MDERAACSRAAKSRKIGSRVGALMSRCARSRESPALLSLAAGWLCLAVSVGKTARAGDVALGAVLLRGIRAALEIARR